MTGGRKAAIDQHCKDCIYDSIGGTGSWRKQVLECTSKNCALYPFRPTPYRTIPKGEIVESSARIEPISINPEPIQLKEPA